jgi:hypothetical protein
MAVLWVVAPCNLVEVYQLFRGPCCLHHQGNEALITLMMEAARTSEKLVNFYQITQFYNPEDIHLRTHRHENLKSYYILKDLHNLYSLWIYFLQVSWLRPSGMFRVIKNVKCFRFIFLHSQYFLTYEVQLFSVFFFSLLWEVR